MSEPAIAADSHDDAFVAPELAPEAADALLDVSSLGTADSRQLQWRVSDDELRLTRLAAGLPHHTSTYVGPRAPTVLQELDVRLLVKASIDGDGDAWNELVRRYASLVAVVIRRYRLAAAGQYLSQLVWLRLLEHLAHIREPGALPRWLVTTTRHECQRYLRVNARSVCLDPLATTAQGPVDDDAIDEALLAAERRQAVLDGLAELAPPQRRLLTLLCADPQLAYAEISRILAIPIGSIGPRRMRALATLRETTAVKAYLQSRGRRDWG